MTYNYFKEPFQDGDFSETGNPLSLSFLNCGLKNFVTMIRKSTRNCCCIISVQCHSWQLPLSRFPKLVPCFKWWKFFIEFIRTKARNRFFFPSEGPLHFNTFNKFPVKSQQKLQQTKWQFNYDIMTFRNNVGRSKREISLSMQLQKLCNLQLLCKM